MKTSRQQVSGWCLILGVAVLGVSAEENAVRNPGFEKTGPGGATQDWTDRKPVYCFADGIGRAGSRGKGKDTMTLKTTPILIRALSRDVRFFCSGFFSNPLRLRITLSPLKWEMEKDHVD